MTRTSCGNTMTKTKSPQRTLKWKKSIVTVLYSWAKHSKTCNLIASTADNLQKVVDAAVGDGHNRGDSAIHNDESPEHV